MCCDGANMKSDEVYIFCLRELTPLKVHNVNEMKMEVTFWIVTRSLDRINSCSYWNITELI